MKARASIPRFDRLAEIASQLEAPSIAADTRALAERVLDGLFHVAFVGQFKRGKSTLINALCGSAVLPVGVAPVTSVVTVVRHGPHAAARCRFVDGEWRDVDPTSLAEYVTEEQNPGNAKGVAGVEVFLPQPLLASGMAFVDTPGLGSVVDANTAATRSFVPHLDAAVIVVGGDPPITGDELALIEEIEQQVEHVLLVMSKADRLSEEDRREAMEFTQRILEERLRLSPPLFVVSGLERLSRAGPPRDFDRLVAVLEALARNHGSELIRAAEERGVERITDRLLNLLNERSLSLTRPIEESERRVAMLKACADEASRSIGDLGPSFAAEQERLGQSLAEQRDEFIARSIPVARTELVSALCALPPMGRSALRREAMNLAKSAFERSFARWRATETPAAEAKYRETARRFVSLANGFLDRLAAASWGEAEAVHPVLDADVGFRTRSRFYSTELETFTSPTPLALLLNLVRSSDAARRAVEHDACDYLQLLLTTNANRVVNALDEQVTESRRRLEGEIIDHLEEVHRAAKHSLDLAREHRASGVQAVATEIRRVDTLRRELETGRDLRSSEGR